MTAYSVRIRVENTPQIAEKPAVGALEPANGTVFLSELPPAQAGPRRPLEAL